MIGATEPQGSRYRTARVQAREYDGIRSQEPAWVVMVFAALCLYILGSWGPRGKGGLKYISGAIWSNRWGV